MSLTLTDLRTTAGNVPCSTGVDVLKYFAGGCEVTGVSWQRWKRSRISLRFLIIIRDKPGVQPVHEARNDPFRTETLACVRHHRNSVLTNLLPWRSVSEKKLQNFTWTEAQLWNMIIILPALMVCWLNTFTSDYMTRSGTQSFQCSHLLVGPHSTGQLHTEDHQQTAEVLKHRRRRV